MGENSKIEWCDHTSRTRRRCAVGSDNADWRQRYDLAQGELEDARAELNLARAELERLKETLNPSKERPNTCPPREIFLNICDEPDMPPLDEIDWSEVTWSANNAATRQAIMYVDLAALFSMQDRALEAEKQLEHLRKDKARLLGALSECRGALSTLRDWFGDMDWNTKRSEQDLSQTPANLCSKMLDISGAAMDESEVRDG